MDTLENKKAPFDTYQKKLFRLITKVKVIIQNREARIENRDGFVIKIEMSCQI